MANIQPYQYQKRTNIEEHNDLVSKINEIVDVINQTNLDTITPKINKLEQDVTSINETVDTVVPKVNKLEQDVSTINDTDNVQNSDINNLKDNNVQIVNRLDNDETNISAITKSLVSDVVLMNGTTTGNMKARIERKNAPSIDSNDYNIQKPVSVELVQGSASAMVKAKITLSDGTVLISDDFMFTTEAIGTDVYISSFTFKNGNVAGTISADIGLSNGSTLTANNFVVPTDPNVISTISDLQSRMTAVESGSGGLTELKATVDGHTTSINELNTDVASLKTDKADVNNNNQIITAGTINANNINKGGVAVATVNDIPDISGKVNIAQGVGNAGKVLGVGSDGNVTPVDGSAGGEVWEEVDLNNFPTDWVDNERFRIEFKMRIYERSGDIVLSHGDFYKSEVMDLRVNSAPSTIINFSMVNNLLLALYIEQINSANYFNGNKQVIIQFRYSLMNISSSSYKSYSSGITRDTTDMTNYIYKIYRLKK